MTLWLGVVLMTAAASFAVLWPLLGGRRSAASDDSDDEVAVYGDRLAEIARDRAAGEPGADAAFVELSRRLLAAAGAGTPQHPGAAWRRNTVVAGVLFVMPLGTLSLYLVLGSPRLPAQPLAARLGQPAETRSAGAPGGRPDDPGHVQEPAAEQAAAIWREKPSGTPSAAAAATFVSGPLVRIAPDEGALEPVLDTRRERLGEAGR